MKRLFTSMLAACLCAGATSGLQAAPPLYWCAEKAPEHQISAAAQPGCRPLVETPSHQERDAAVPDSHVPAEPLPPLTAQDIETEAGAFLARYRNFLLCCATDVDRVNELKALEKAAGHLLVEMQRNFATEQIKLRSFSYTGLIQRVAQARDDLQKLKTRWSEIQDGRRAIERLDYSDTARARRRLQEQEDAIATDFRPSQPPPPSRTGREIANTTLPNRIGAEQTGGPPQSRDEAAFGQEPGSVDMEATGTPQIPTGSSIGDPPLDSP